MIFSGALRKLNDPDKSWSILAIKILAPLACIGVLSLFAQVLSGARTDAHRNASASALNLATVLSQDIARNFELYDLSLQGVVTAMADPGISTATPSIRQLALFDHASGARYLNRTIVIDAEGNAIAESRPGPSRPENLSDRAYFTMHRDKLVDGLFISKPIQSRYDGDWIITLSRRYNRPDGSFGGVVAGSLSLGYFQSLFMNLKTSKDDLFRILATDGTLIMRQPYRLPEIGKDFSRTDLFNYFPAEQSGVHDRKSSLDDVDRIYAFARVPNFPFIVTVASSKTQIEMAWKEKAVSLGLMMLSLAAIILALGVSLAREFSLRRKTEGKLAATASRLEFMSRTDRLTGLNNRWAFDELVAKEWKRAIREQTEFSILMIDVDHFKRYNDEHGHLRGDGALIQVAECIEKHIKRPADVSARFGGEEFAVILPVTAAAGAMKVAEDIRNSVALVHLGNPGMPSLTVSIGVTSTIPARTAAFDQAFNIADKALYLAKSGGRNRVVYQPVEIANESLTSTA
ncbi:MAG: putative diguanylate cyclase [Hyphomicrobiales bacterium]|nr:putative diguanylate cyclase [Hyphomicrobiales bacterium]